MKLVTFNIRYDCGKDGENNFEFRKDLILRKIRAEMPEVICFQEVLTHIAAWLKESLPEYYVVGCPREQNLVGEGLYIAYRHDKLGLFRLENFWLSPTPEVPASRYQEQSKCPRVCTEVILQDIASSQCFRVVNVHLDHISSLARVLGTQQILDKLEKESFLPDIPAIVTGDFNATPDAPEIQLFKNAPKLRCVTEGIGNTFHGYGKAEPMEIDYIFAHPDIQCEKAEKWTDTDGPVYISDHYPVCAEFNLPDSKECLA